MNSMPLEKAQLSWQYQSPLGYWRAMWHLIQKHVKPKIANHFQVSQWAYPDDNTAISLFCFACILLLSLSIKPRAFIVSSVTNCYFTSLFPFYSWDRFLLNYPDGSWIYSVAQAQTMLVLSNILSPHLNFS